MTENELKDLEKSLMRHSTLLAKLLNDPRKIEDELYLPIAGQLRVLLCDSNLPILLKYAQAKNIPLPILVPPKLFSDSEETLPLLQINFLKIGWTYKDDSLTNSIQEFLDKPYGIVPIKNPDGTSKGSSFTPKQIIKWVANKEGVAHLDFSKPATFNSFKSFIHHSNGKDTEGALVQKLIFELARWTNVAISWVLCFRNIRENVYNNLNSLNAYSEILPTNLPLIAHYKLLENGLKGAYLEGEHILESSDMNVNLISGYSWNAMLKLINQINPGTTYLYETAGKNSKLSLNLDNQGRLNFSLIVNDSNVYTVAIEQIIDTKYFNEFIFLSCQIGVNERYLTLSIYINSDKVKIKKFEIEHEIGILTKQVLGGNLEGKFKSSFIVRELVIANKYLSKNETFGLSKYLWMEWVREQSQKRN